MARKAKKRSQQMPPLSFVDKLIYCIHILFVKESTQGVASDQETAAADTSKGQSKSA